MNYSSRLKAPFSYSGLALAMFTIGHVNMAHAANSCLAGTFELTPKGECTEAPLGFFVANDGATAATAAPVGTYVDTIGASTATRASVGTFVSSTGQSSATQAPVGTFVNSIGASTATKASVGTFVSSAGQSSATQAPVGTFVNSIGASTATRASVGTFVSSAGQSSATQAPVGTFVDSIGASTAARASVGTFVSSAGQSSATRAPVGSFVNSVGASTATRASVGTFVSSAGQSSATQAPVGTYVDSIGASTATKASVGTFVASTGQSSATLAPVGTFVNTIGAINASLCQGDSTSYGGSVACRAGNDLVNNIVSPVFGSNYIAGGDFDLGVFYESDTTMFEFEILNLSHDLGFDDPLTGLTLLDISFTGQHADFFTLDGFLPGSVLFEGDALSFDIIINTFLKENFDVIMTITTDQQAAFGEEGLLFSYHFTGLVENTLPPVPVPSAFILMLSGLLGMFKFRSVQSKKR